MHRRDPIRPKRFAVLAVNLVAIALLLGLAEVSLAWRGLAPYRRTYPGEPHGGGVRWARPDSTLGWTINPELLPGEINPQGFRDPTDFNQLSPDQAASRILVLGDSFVAGSRQVPADRTVPALLRQRLDTEHQVVNMAAPGWGIDQMYLAYQRHVDAILPDIVILAFIDDDVHRVLEAVRLGERLPKPSFTIENGKLVERHAATHRPTLLDRAAGKSILLGMIAREWHLASDAGPVVRRLFLDLAADVQNRGGRLTILRIPTRDHDHLITGLRRRLFDFERALAGSGAVYLDAAEVITGVPDWKRNLYIEDGHLNDRGNQLLVDYLTSRAFGS